MRRPVALALTIVIFAAIAVCFLRPVDLNPDFGNVPAFAGYGLWEEITDCTGDTDLLTIDAIDWSRFTDGELYLRVTPYRDQLYISSSFTRKNGELHPADERGVTGFAEKKVDGKWTYVGELEVSDKGAVMLIVGADMNRVGCAIYAESEIFGRAFVRLPEYDYGETYRLTYFFLEIDEDGHPCEDVHSITHTVTLPEKTDRRLDFVSLGWSNSSGYPDVYPEIRVNYGKAPYLMLNHCKLERKENGKWAEALWRGEPAFSVYGNEAIKELQPCKRTESHYCLPRSYYIYLDEVISDYRLTLVFCDNPDGSGEQYTLTLNLRFDG